jgi:hypothetical protein
MAYLKERVAQEEYKKALMERHPLMNSAISNAATQGMWAHQNSGLSGAQNMGAVNQAWPQAPMEPKQFIRDNTRQFAVEKVDNGFIIRSGKYSKICKDVEELSNQFVAIIVEAQLDK